MKHGVALVTGGSRGIGAAIAKELAQAGNHVVINCKSNIDKANEVKAACEAFGVQAIVIAADVSDFAVCEAMIKETIDTFGHIDILVNNAGITRDMLLARMSEMQFDDVIGANLKSAFNMMRVCSPHMMRARYGRIINISSVAGVRGNAGQVNYAASKAGLIGMTMAAAKELGSRGITVNAVAPGFIETDMTAGLSDKIKEGAVQMIALRRIGQPEEIAAVVGFLASERASYITGQVIVADGGM